MVMVHFLKKTQELSEQSNLFSIPVDGQAMMRMQAGGMSCLLKKCGPIKVKI